MIMGRKYKIKIKSVNEKYILILHIYILSLTPFLMNPLHSPTLGYSIIFVLPSLRSNILLLTFPACYTWLLSNYRRVGSWYFNLRWFWFGMGHFCSPGPNCRLFHTLCHSFSWTHLFDTSSARCCGKLPCFRWSPSTRFSCRWRRKPYWCHYALQGWTRSV